MIANFKQVIKVGSHLHFQSPSSYSLSWVNVEMHWGRKEHMGLLGYITTVAPMASGVPEFSSAWNTILYQIFQASGFLMKWGLMIGWDSHSLIPPYRHLCSILHSPSETGNNASGCGVTPSVFSTRCHPSMLLCPIAPLPAVSWIIRCTFEQLLFSPILEKRKKSLLLSSSFYCPIFLLCFAVQLLGTFVFTGCFQFLMSCSLTPTPVRLSPLLMILLLTLWHWNCSYQGQQNPHVSRSSGLSSDLFSLDSPAAYGTLVLSLPQETFSSPGLWAAICLKFSSCLTGLHSVSLLMTQCCNGSLRVHPWTSSLPNPYAHCYWLYLILCH